MIASLASAGVVWQNWLSPHALNKTAESTVVLPAGIFQDIVDSLAQHKRPRCLYYILWLVQVLVLLGNPGNGKLQIVIWAIHHIIHQECSSSGSPIGTPHSDHLRARTAGRNHPMASMYQVQANTVKRSLYDILSTPCLLHFTWVCQDFKG